jgi:hypothetical protein
MKTKRRSSPDDMKADYELDYATAIRGKYYRKLLKEGANVVLLEPDVAKAFHSSAAVNQALRSLLEVFETTRRLTMKRKRRARVASTSHPQGVGRTARR